MNEAASAWCLSVAGERVHGTTRQKPIDLFQREEAATLRRLPAEPFEQVSWTEGMVAHDYHVSVFGKLYSVPYRYRGKTLAVRLSNRTVEFYLNQELVKTHPRLGEGKRRQTDWADYPPHKADFYQRTPDWCRTNASSMGPYVEQAVGELLERHALHYLRQCQGIIGLAKKYGAERLNAACQRAVAFDDGSYKTIKGILEKGLDAQLALPLGERAIASVGAYLRGPEELFGRDQENDEGQ
jgi:transposase